MWERGVNCLELISGSEMSSVGSFRLFFHPRQAAVGPLFSEPLASHTGIQAGMPIKPISLEIHVL